MKTGNQNIVLQAFNIFIYPFLLLAKGVNKTEIGLLNLFTWVRFSLHYVLKSQQVEGIQFINLDGNKFRVPMILGTLAFLPKNVLDLIKEKDVTVIYGKDRECFLEGNFSGLYNPEHNFIFVWDDGFFGNWGWQVTTTLHEVGHFVDFSVGYYNNTWLSCGDKSLHNIYNGEHKYYKRYQHGKYYTSNIKEYFAQGFAEFFLVPGFKQQCPDTALYIEGILETI